MFALSSPVSSSPSLYILLVTLCTIAYLGRWGQRIGIAGRAGEKLTFPSATSVFYF